MKQDAYNQFADTENNRYNHLVCALILSRLHRTIIESYIMFTEQHNTFIVAAEKKTTSSTLLFSAKLRLHMVILPFSKVDLCFVGVVIFNLLKKRKYIKHTRRPHSADYA